MNDNRINLDLTTMGNLNNEVRALLPLLVKSIPFGDTKAKARLNISIDLRRAQDSDTLLAVSYSVKPTYPKKAQGMLCRSDLTGNLSIDAEDLTERTLTFPTMTNTMEE